MKQYSYPLDVSWSTEEMMSVLHFFNQVEQAYESKVNVDSVLHAYQAFKQVVPGKAQEKQLDKAFEQASGYSTYKVVKTARDLSKGTFSLGK